jgi:hypothetical protein
VQFSELKLASDSTDSAYLTYDEIGSSDSEEKTGEPDVKWNQIVFVQDLKMIYCKRTTFDCNLINYPTKTEVENSYYTKVEIDAMIGAIDDLLDQI